MGKINGCLKCFFVFFNVVFAIIGCLLIFGTVKVSAAGGQFSSGMPGIGWGWVFAIGVLGISCLGIYAGCTEKELALKIFAGFMAAGILVMLIFGIYVAVQNNKIKDAYTNDASKASKFYMENEDFRAMIASFQSSLKCCGLSSAEDWGSTIPNSCACEGSSERIPGFAPGECKDRPEGTIGPVRIYATPCGLYLFQSIDFVMKIAMGFLFGCMVTALLGLLMTLLMLHQVRQP